jgi:hypothetical protein
MKKAGCRDAVVLMASAPGAEKRIKTTNIPYFCPVISEKRQ